LQNSIIVGKARIFGDNINTDLISPAQYMECSNEVIAAHAMEGIDPLFTKRIQVGDILVAGKNFGSGSSRETAPIALKGAGISVIIAEFYARIFYRNCINIGLPALICTESPKINEGDVLEIHPMEGIIKNITQNTEYTCPALSYDIMQILKAGGLLPRIKNQFNKDI